MGISQYLKEIGRGARGAKPLTREQATDLFGQVLDGTVTDLEIGAFCLAMRIKGETAEECAAFSTPRTSGLALLPATDRPLIVLPSYNGGASCRADAAAGTAAGPRGPTRAAARHAHRSTPYFGIRRASSA